MQHEVSWSVFYLLPILFVTWETGPKAAVLVSLLSAWDPEANEALVLKAGVLAFLRKPADNETLLSSIRKALE